LEHEFEDNDLENCIKNRKEIIVFSENQSNISFIITKIMPNSYDAFLDVESMNNARQGYCDSCFCMMSIQADGGIAYCCCDPSANTVFHHNPMKVYRKSGLGRK